jgi:hypothetical protein
VTDLNDRRRRCHSDPIPASDERERLLPALYGRVLIPPAELEELSPLKHRLSAPANDPAKGAQTTAKIPYRTYGTWAPFAYRRLRARRLPDQVE